MIAELPKYKIYTRALCTNVVDADTFDIAVTVDIGFYIEAVARIRFRIKDFDAPEVKSLYPLERAHSDRAITYATYLLKRVGIKELHSFKEGAYNRWECNIILNDGRDFVAAMRKNRMEKQKSYV